jgi:hypothetical protein
MSSFGSIVKDAGLAVGLNITGCTDSAEVLGLVKTLRPMDCGKDLIRIGGTGDGGYLVPDDLEGIEYCFSPGVSTTVDFETHLAALNIKQIIRSILCRSKSQNSSSTKNFSAPMTTRSSSLLSLGKINIYGDTRANSFCKWISRALNMR